MSSSLCLYCSAFAASLRRYFRSGWVFLIPYLAGYLLYWWLKWPVNPVAEAQPKALSSA
jgi:hypothetical protein